MKKIICAIIGLMMTATSAHGAAPDSEPDFSPPLTFAFDVPGGEYQSDQRQITCSVNTVQGTLTMEQYRWNATWHPGIVIFLTRGSGANERLISLAFSASTYHPPFRVRLGSALDDSKDLGSVMFETKVGQTGTFSFSLRWNANGDVTAAVAGEQHTFNLGGRPDLLRINGSGGAGSLQYALGHIADQVGDEDCKPIA